MHSRFTVLTVATCLLGAMEGNTMTCNIARPYDPAKIELTFKIPTFSRVRADLIFQKGDRLEICAFPPQRPVRCEWRLSLNQIEKPFLTGTGEVGLDQSVIMTVPADKLRPGFYDLRFTVWATATSKTEGCTTFGYCIDKLPLTDSRPADFDAFWRQARAKVDATPLNAAETPVREFTDAEVSAYNVASASIPEDYDPDGKRSAKVRLFKVQFDAPGPKRMSAWLALPDGKGPFPGLLVLPGAGCTKVPAPLEQARHGFVALMLQIHGMDVDQEKYETPKDYLQVKGGAVADEYYYGVYMACMQAVRYLASRPEVNPDKLAVAGSSQGGMLTIITAALCPNVKAAVSSLCYYGYWPYRDQITAVNAATGDGLDAGPPSFSRQDARQNTLSYYDAMNFAPLIRAPTLMCGCLCDGPCPPATVHAVYRRLGSKEREFHWSPGTNHDLMFAFERLAWRWLETRLALPAVPPKP